MRYMRLFQFWLPQGICLGVGLLGHYGDFIPRFYFFNYFNWKLITIIGSLLNKIFFPSWVRCSSQFAKLVSPSLLIGKKIGPLHLIK